MEFTTGEYTLIVEGLKLLLDDTLPPAEAQARRAIHDRMKKARLQHIEWQRALERARTPAKPPAKTVAARSTARQLDPKTFGKLLFG